MPKSKAFGKEWIDTIYADLYKDSEIRNVIDIGVGRGTFSMRLRNAHAGVTWLGIEAWQPYVEEFSLREKYDRLIINDARSVDFGKLEHFDVAFMGDVLEHMAKGDAIRLTKTILGKARFAIVSVPITHTPQEDFAGNPFEIHVKDDWCHEEAMLSLPGVRAWYVEGINGVYLLAKDRDDADILMNILKKLNRGLIKDAVRYGYGDISLLEHLGLRLRYIILKPLRMIYYFARQVYRKAKGNV